MPLRCTEANLNKYTKKSTSLQPDTQGAQQENQETKHISHATDRQDQLPVKSLQSFWSVGPNAVSANLSRPPSTVNTPLYFSRLDVGCCCCCCCCCGIGLLYTWVTLYTGCCGMPVKAEEWYGLDWKGLYPGLGPPPYEGTEPPGLYDPNCACASCGVYCG